MFKSRAIRIEITRKSSDLEARKKLWADEFRRKYDTVEARLVVKRYGRLGFNEMYAAVEKPSTNSNCYRK